MGGGDTQGWEAATPTPSQRSMCWGRALTGHSPSQGAGSAGSALPGTQDTVGREGLSQRQEGLVAAASFQQAPSPGSANRTGSLWGRTACSSWGAFSEIYCCVFPKLEANSLHLQKQDKVHSPADWGTAHTPLSSKDFLSRRLPAGRGPDRGLCGNTSSPPRTPHRAPGRCENLLLKLHLSAWLPVVRT